MYDLPSEFPEEPGLPDEYHDLQPQLLSRTLSLTAHSRDNWFTGSDLNLYYDARHPLWHKRPDWFLAVNVPRLYEGREWRRSYVIWQEGQSPRIVIEFLSPKTEREDLGRFYQESDWIPEPETAVKQAVIPRMPNKVEVYEQYLRVPHYLVYSRYTERLRYFKLIGGQYEEQPLPSKNPLVWMEDLSLGLGVWQGSFEGVTGSWLRWCDRSGTWFLTDTEAERLAKEEAQLKAERLAQRLRELGVDPEDL
jgi:Uma2 family endonuclease